MFEVPNLWPSLIFCNVVNFYGEDLLAFSPVLKLEGHLLSGVCSYVFTLFAATLGIPTAFPPFATLECTMLWQVTHTLGKT